MSAAFARNSYASRWQGATSSSASRVPPNWRSFEALEHTVRTGLPATETVFPGGFWGYYGAHPEEGALFNAAMAGKVVGKSIYVGRYRGEPK